MGTRLEFHEVLVGLLGSRNVYYQPPESVRMKYPAIVYELDEIEARYADNLRYRNLNRYRVTIIDSDPDSGLPEKITTLPLCRFQRHYTSDNLHHFTFQIYY